MEYLVIVDKKNSEKNIISEHDYFDEAFEKRSELIRNKELEKVRIYRLVYEQKMDV